MNCSSDVKILEILGLQHQISSFSRSLEQIFLTVGQNNFGNKIPLNGNLEPFWNAFAESNSSEAISSIMANFEMAKNIRLQIFFCHFKFCHNK